VTQLEVYRPHSYLVIVDSLIEVFCIVASAPLYFGDRQIHEDLEVSFFTNTSDL